MGLLLRLWPWRRLGLLLRSGLHRLEGGWLLDDGLQLLNDVIVLGLRVSVGCVLALDALAGLYLIVN